MADGGTITLISESEYVYDFFCELCFDDGKQIQAYGYCSDCEEYLCEKCFNGHTSTRQTRHHVLLDKEAMPKDTPTSVERTNKDISTKCKIHKAKPVEFYCPVHNVLGCSTCFATVHKGCQDVESVLEKAEDILESQKLKNFKATLETLKIKSDQMIKLARDNRCVSKKFWTDLVSSVKQIKEEAIQAINESESSILVLANTIRFEDDEKMENIVKECNTLYEQLEEITTSCEHLLSSKRVCQLYIEMQNTEDKVKTLTEELRIVAEKNSVRRFELKRFLRYPDALGEIVFQDNTKIETCMSSPNEAVNITRVTNLDARAVENRNDEDLFLQCEISGIDAISSERLIFVDNCQSNIKISDINSDTIISELKVESKPWDVTVMNRKQAAVTLPASKKILILGITGTLKKKWEITVRGACHGVAYTRGKLVVTYTDNARLEILYMNGIVTRTIDRDSHGLNLSYGRQLFDRPEYTCVSTDGKTIYVSDYDRNTVTSLTFDGVVLSVYTDEKLSRPQSVCTDQKGNVYVSDSSSIHMITADCTNGKVIMPDLTGPECCVRSVSHCHTTNILIIGMSASSAIFVEQLS